MGYRGWHGVTDPKRILIAVSYEPIEGSLACKFCTGEPVIHINVPEEKYLILLKSPFAGTYYRKYIKPKYPYMPGTEPPRIKVKIDKEAIEAKQRILDAERLEASKRLQPQQQHLF